MSWAPLIGPERQESEGLRQAGYDRLAPSVLDTIDVAFGEAAEEYSAGGALARLGRMSWAERTGTPITAEQWQASPSYRPGLSWYDGMTEASAAVLAERKDRRDRRADIMARDQSGFIGHGAQWAAGFIGQMADPIGIAAGFVPVVGEAQYARLLAQLGRFGARAVTGAVEGAVGNALLEPLVYGAAQKDQLDYSMADSLVNIAKGALFGTAWRTGGGALVDLARTPAGERVTTAVRSYASAAANLIRRKGADVHVAATDAAIRQAVGGQEIDVRPVLRAEAEPPAAAAPSAVPTPVGRAAGALAPDAQQRGSSLPQDGSSGFAERRAEAERALAEAFPVRDVPLASGAVVRRQGPMDLITFLRTKGGVRDEGGELGDLHLLNRGRDAPFAKGEMFFGRLVSDQGLSLEEAARVAAEAGYIGRPVLDDGADRGVRARSFEGSTHELVDALERTARAGLLEQRVWAEGDHRAVLDHAAWMRSIDEEEAMRPPRPEPWEALDPHEHGMIDDPDLGRSDDPEALWREELERQGLAADGPPPAEGAGQPPSPAQELEQHAARVEAGYRAAAACIARALA